MKHKEYQVGELKFQLVPYSDSDGIGYIRIAKTDGSYLGAFDESTRLTTLKALRKTIDTFIKRKQK